MVVTIGPKCIIPPSKKCNAKERGKGISLNQFAPTQTCSAVGLVESIIINLLSVSELVTSIYVSSLFGFLSSLSKKSILKLTDF